MNTTPVPRSRIGILASYLFIYFCNVILSSYFVKGRYHISRVYIYGKREIPYIYIYIERERERERERE